jgi:hypothetical protein
MTASQWFAEADVLTLLRWIAPRTSPRKVRLYFCGGLRQLEDLLFDSGSVGALETSEQFADGLASASDLASEEWSAEPPTWGHEFEAEFVRDDPRYASEVSKLVQLGALSESVLFGGEWRVNEAVRDRLIAAANIAWELTHKDLEPELEWLSCYIRGVDWPGRWLVDCVFGNPFEPVQVDPAWLTWDSGSIPRMARTIYDERAFDRLPIVGNMLSDCGCRSLDILDHCRMGGLHVRGCWVLDLILGLN